MTEEKKIYGGLQETPPDERDFQLGALYSLPKLEDVPAEFIIGTPKIKDQGESDLCTAFAVTSASGYQEFIELNPEYQFFKTKQLQGNDSWGADIRTALKSAVKYGSLPELNKVLTLSINGRAAILNPSLWPALSDQIALKFKKNSYFKVTGPFSLFDNIRAAMWKYKDKKCAVVTGAMWQSIWTSALDGVVPGNTNEGPGFGHAFIFIGTSIIENEIRLIAQLSNGTEIGDGGLFYFNREVVNAFFEKYGAYILIDENPETIKYLIANNLTAKSAWWVKILLIIKNLLT